MPSKNPATRAKVNALYYQRVMSDPAKHAARRAREERWRRANMDKRREQQRRTGKEVAWRQKLGRWLMRIVRAEEARGRFE